MPFGTLFREICGFVCARFTGTESVDLPAQLINNTFCSPTASAIILEASSTIPTLDGTPSFGLTSLIMMFWCILLSIVYLMSFPNRLSTTLATALERSRAEALQKELLAIKTGSENLSSKHQLALDELNTKLIQTAITHDLDTQNVLRDATEKHAKSTKTMVDEYQKKIIAAEEECKKMTKKMNDLYEEKRRIYVSNQLNMSSELRLQISMDNRRNKKATAAFQKDIHDQEIHLERAANKIAQLKTEQTQVANYANELRRKITTQQVRTKRLTTILAEKDDTINDLTQKLQRTEKRLKDNIAAALCQESVDERDWNFLEQKISKLEKEAALAWGELRGSETHVQILTNQLRETCDLYNAANSEAERQTKAARTYASRAALKRARMRKVVTKRSQHTRSPLKVEGQATAPEAAKDEDHSKRVPVKAQVTAQTISDPELAQPPKAVQLKRLTYNLRTLEAELLKYRESAKTSQTVTQNLQVELLKCKESAKTSQTVTQDLQAAKASLILSESELKMLRTGWDQERIEYLSAQTELGVVKQKLSHVGQHSEQLQAQVEAIRQSLDQERIKHSKTQTELDEVKQKPNHDGQHSKQLQAQLESVRQSLDQERSRAFQFGVRVSELDRGLQECKQHGKALKKQLEESRNATSTASTKVAELTLALDRANQQAQDKEDETLALQQLLAECAVEEGMELDGQIEETPMEWQDVLARVTADAGEVPDHVGDSTALMDMVDTYPGPGEAQSGDASMEDEGPEEVALRMAEPMSVDPTDTAMTAAPTASESASPIASAIVPPIGFCQAPDTPHENGLSSQFPSQAPQDMSGHFNDVFDGLDQSLFDPALFEEAQATLPPPDTDTPTFSQALGFLAMVNFELQQPPDEPANYPEPPRIPAPFLFDPHLMSLDEFTVTPQPQRVASLPYFSAPAEFSAGTSEGPSQTEKPRMQATAPPFNALLPSQGVQSSVGMVPSALPTSSSTPTTSFAADPALSLIQQGKRREDPPANVEAEDTSAASAKPEGSGEGHLEKRPEGQSWKDGIDPSHEIFNAGYTASDFDDDDGSTISSVRASEFADWDARQAELDATKDDDGHSSDAGEIGLEPGDFDNYYSDIESHQGDSDEHNGEGSDNRTTDSDKEFADFVEDMKTQLADEDVKAKIEAAKLKKIDEELKARARRAGPGPSSSNTAPTERRVIAPKSKKNKCKSAPQVDLGFG